MTAQRLADWILSRQDGVTHLKLQKLAFYCYGIASAFQCSDVGVIPFVAWKHGPVCAELYDRFRACGTGELPKPTYLPAPYEQQTEQVLSDVLAVYGRLDAWQLRNQSHLERPWIETPQSAPIDATAIACHFAQKYCSGRPVTAPEYVSGAWSLALDGIPSRTYRDFSELAASLNQPLPTALQLA